MPRRFIVNYVDLVISLDCSSSPIYTYGVFIWLCHDFVLFRHRQFMASNYCAERHERFLHTDAAVSFDASKRYKAKCRCRSLSSRR